MALFQAKPADDYHNPNVVAIICPEDASKPKAKLVVVDKSWDEQNVAVLKQKAFAIFHSKWNTLKIKEQDPLVTFELSTTSFPQEVVSNAQAGLNDGMA